MEICERIFTTPIPLIYTRHTARFLLLWLLTVPMSLYNEFTIGKKWIVPIVSFLSSIFLFGIEDLGVQIEEPFSILPLANICYNIHSSAQSILIDSNIQWFHGCDKANIYSHMQQPDINLSSYSRDKDILFLGSGSGGDDDVNDDHQRDDDSINRNNGDLDNKKYEEYNNILQIKHINNSI